MSDNRHPNPITSLPMYIAIGFGIALILGSLARGCTAQAQELDDDFRTVMRYQVYDTRDNSVLGVIIERDREEALKLAARVHYRVPPAKLRLINTGPLDESELPNQPEQPEELYEFSAYELAAPGDSEGTYLGVVTAPNIFRAFDIAEHQFNPRRLRISATQRRAPAAVVQTNEPQGYYLFQSTIGGKEEARPTWPTPNMTGIVLRIAADQIVTGSDPNDYDFSKIDQRLRQLNPSGAKVKYHYQLQIHTGVHVPLAWVKNGAKTVAFNHKNYGRQRMLDPADPKARVLYRNLLQAVAAKYGNDVLLDVVHVTFPQAFSPEMHMPIELIKRSGYFQMIEESYGYGIGVIASCFPNKQICLNLYNCGKAEGGQGNGKQGLRSTRTIAEAALERYDGRVRFQLNGWNAKDSFADYDIYEMLIALAKQGAQTGLEQVSGSNNQDRYGGTFEASLKYLPRCWADYALIYPPDMAKAKKFPVAPQKIIAPEEDWAKYGD